jgi:hypothetical protein
MAHHSLWLGYGAFAPSIERLMSLSPWPVPPYLHRERGRNKSILGIFKKPSNAHLLFPFYHNSLPLAI